MTGSVIRGRASRTPLPNARDTARPYLHPHFSFSLYSILSPAPPSQLHPAASR